MIPVVILAGGEGRRFGGNKLLADLNGLPLVLHTALRLQRAGAFDVTIVTCHEEIQQLCEDYGLFCLFSGLCREGLSGSVRAAVQFLLKSGKPATVFCGGDQPFLTAETIRSFYEAWQLSGKGAASCQTESSVTNPVIFSARYYPKLLALRGDQGGRSVLQENEEDCFLYFLKHPEEAVDIDRPQQLEAARKREDIL